MVSLSEFSVAIAAASVTIAACFAIMQVRNLVKNRKMDTMMRLYLAWNELELKKSFSRFMAAEITTYEDFVAKHGNYASPDHAQIWTDIDRVCWFVNGYGCMVYRGLADIRDVDDLFGHGVVLAWEKVSPIVGGLRKDLKSPKTWQWFEYLYRELEKRNA